MRSLVRGNGRLPLKAFAIALGIWFFSGSSVMADDFGHPDFSEGRFKHNNLGQGTLGWAEYGLYPGCTASVFAGIRGTVTAATHWALAPMADIRSTAAPAIPTSRRHYDGLGQRHLLRITAALTTLVTTDSNYL